MRDPHLAGDITQAVFIILARKADSLGDRTILSGWLCRTARYASANALKIQRRRQQREQEAFMQNTLDGGSDASSQSISEEAWNEIAPLLDGAMEHLGQKDHDALVLRFFESKNFAEVGAALGASEDAAKMRVSRALEKLRKFFSKRGVSSTTAIIAGVVSANSVQAAPVGLAKTISAVAIAKGPIAAASTLTLVKGTMKTMTWLKMKFALGLCATLLMTIGTVTITLSETDKADNLPAKEIAQLASEKYASLTSYSDTGKTVLVMNGQTADITTSNTRMERTNLFRIEWESIPPQATPTKNAVWSAGDGYFCIQAETSSTPPAWAKKERTMKAALGYAGMAAAFLTDAFFNPSNAFKLYESEKGKTVQRKKDEKVVGIGCYVVTQTISLKDQNISDTLWIGKKRFSFTSISGGTVNKWAADYYHRDAREHIIEPII